MYEDYDTSFEDSEDSFGDDFYEDAAVYEDDMYDDLYNWECEQIAADMAAGEMDW